MLFLFSRVFQIEFRDFGANSQLKCKGLKKPCNMKGEKTLNNFHESSCVEVIGNIMYMSYDIVYSRNLSKTNASKN